MTLWTNPAAKQLQKGVPRRAIETKSPGTVLTPTVSPSLEEDERGVPQDARTVGEWVTHIMRQQPSVQKLLRGRGGHVQSPESLRIILKYAARYTITCTAGAIAYYSFRADCFDPDLTGAGGQPTGFDQWMAFYTRYRVHRFRFHANVSTANQATPTYVGVLAGACLPSVSPLAGTETISAIRAMPWGRLAIINGIGSPPVHHDSGWINVHEVLGLTKAEFEANEDTWGTASAVAPLYAIWAMGWESADNSNSLLMVGYGEIELDTEFFNRARLVTS